MESQAPFQEHCSYAVVLTLGQQQIHDCTTGQNQWHFAIYP